MKNELLNKHINRILFLNIFLFSVFFSQPTFIFAQENFVFENFSIPQGLSNPTINTIIEDKYGFLWLGTNDGLSEIWNAPMAGFFTYGEYGRAVNGRQEHHSTACSWVALKEK